MNRWNSETQEKIAQIRDLDTRKEHEIESRQGEMSTFQTNLLDF